MKKPKIKPGCAYSNGDFGNRWVVRQVLAVNLPGDGIEYESVTFKVLVGQGRRSKGSCSMEEFVQWVRHEVVRNENSWERLAEETDL